MTRLQALLGALLLGQSAAVLSGPSLMAYLSLNSLSAAVWAYDKIQAQAGRARAPEWTLHVLAWVAGPGAALARHFFRHKSQKPFFGVSTFAGLMVGAGFLLEA